MHYASLSLIDIGLTGVLLGVYFVVRRDVCAMAIAHTLYNAVVVGLTLYFSYPA